MAFFLFVCSIMKKKKSKALKLNQSLIYVPKLDGKLL